MQVFDSACEPAALSECEVCNCKSACEHATTTSIGSDRYCLSTTGMVRLCDLTATWLDEVRASKMIVHPRGC